jgi:mRNA interferase MazF
VLEVGEVVWVDFDPSFGHEQAGRRPALVLSESSYNRASSFILVCPITRSAAPWPFKVVLSGLLSLDGQILVDQIKSIDKNRIVTPAVDKIDEATLSKVRGLLAPLLGWPQLLSPM